MSWINRKAPESGRRPDPPSHSGSWFERHPKTTVLGFFLVIVMILTYASEKILSSRTPDQKGVKRCIRLKEHEPFQVLAYKIGKDSHYLHDGLEEKEYVIRVDKDGFIEPARVHEQPDLTLVFLGGSTTECFFVDSEKRFPYLTGRLLEQASGLRINSLNSGVSGNNSLHSLDILLNKAIPHKPAVAVLMHNLNDLSILFHEHSYWNANPFRSPVLDITPTVGKNLAEVRDLLIPNLYQRFSQLTGRLGSIFRGQTPGEAGLDEFQQARGRTPQKDPAFLLDEFAMNLQTFINICQARRIVPVLMTQESRLTAEPDDVIKEQLKNLEIPYSSFKDLFDRFNQTVREVGARNEVLVIDLAARIPQTREYIYSLVHLNNRGSQLAAEIISRELLPLITSRQEGSPRPALAPGMEPRS